jgi:RimJ/RimL family protein N-acetyltransferase
MRNLIGWATENPVLVKVKLGAIVTNLRAIELYRRLGFVEEGQLPREFGRSDGTYLDGVLMYRFVEHTLPAERT